MEILDLLLCLMIMELLMRMKQLAEDNHMLATVRNNQKEMFLPLLTENEVYTISNIKVVPGPASYRTVDSDLALNFYYKTKIQKVADTGIIPRFKFVLKEFEEAQTLVNNVKTFIDVIGMVTTYGNLETRSNGARKIDVILANARNEKLVVALWEAKALEFQESLAGTKGSAVFAVITGLMAKNFSGQVILSSSDATKTYLNIEYTPLHILRDAMLVTTRNTTSTLPIPTAKLFVNAEYDNLGDMSIKKILEATLPSDTTVLRCTCKAAIVGLMEDSGWYYNCCPRCARKVRAIDGKYYCESCAEEANDFKPRYKLIVRVQDDTALSTFTLFNKEVEQLIGVPVEKIIADLSEDIELSEFPPVIKNIVGNRCTFYIKINAYNTQRDYEEYTVFRLSECAPPSSENSDKQQEGQGAKRQKT